MPSLGTRLFGAALAGAGQGIVAQAAQRREESLLALRRKWQVEDRNQQRTWDVEDRDYREDRADTRAAANQPLVPIVGDEGSAIYSTRGDAVGKAVPTKPSSRAPGRPVEVVDPKSGRTILVPPEQAYGLSPPAKDKGDGKLYVLSEDPATGARTYGTREDALAAGQMQEGDGEAENEALKARAEAAFDALGPEWNESIDWINPFVDSDEKAAGASKEEFVARLMDAMRQNPGVPDDELARQLVAQLGGNKQGGGAGPAPAAAAAGPPPEHPNARQAPDGNWYIPAGDGKWQRVQ